jgi:hypothetical protein
LTITKTLKVTTVMAVLTFATFFMASGFSSLTMGSFLITDAFAQGGQNVANQGISQANNAANSALCTSGVLTGAACNSTTNQGNANSGSNTAGQTAGGGTGKGATGGTNTANQGISQSNAASTASQCASGTLTGPACNSTTNQGNANSGSNTAGQTAGGGTGTGATTKSFHAKLTGKNEVPPKDTTATGTATFNVIGTDKINYEVHVKDMKMVTAAHIHQGKAGENGPVLVTLYNNPTPSATTNGELAKGTITSTNLEGPLAGKQVKDLINMIQSGGTYANVHTTANPMGEIRGQIVAEKTVTGATGGTNTANQGISQSNAASTASQCASGTLTGPACNSTTNQGNANSGSNTAGQVAGGGGTQ